MTLISFFEKLNKIPLYLLALLIPIFFLPFALNVLDFPKQYLASILILLSLIGWLGGKIYAGKVALRGSKILYISLFLIFFSLLLSSFFSLGPKISFFGYPADIADNFLSLFLFLILIFLLINSFKAKAEFFPVLFSFLLSGAIAGIFNLLQIYEVFLFPFDFSKTSSFNTIGTPNSFALFGAVLLPISLIILFFLSKGCSRIILGVITFLLFGNVVLINFRTAWVALIIGILVLFIFGFGKEKKIRTSIRVLLMIGLIFSVFFYFFPIPLPGFPVLPPEVSISSSSEIHILRGSFDEGIKNIILGTGPGTFVFAYSLYRSPLLNQTLFWGTRFSRGSSVFLGWVLTKGILGGATLLFFYSLIIYFIFRYLKKNETKKFFEMKLGFSAAILSLIFISFLYPFNFVFYFTFAFLIGGFFLFFSPKLTEITLSSSSRMILANAILMLVIVSTLGLSFLQGQRYFAEMKYLRGIEAFRAGNLDQAISRLQKAGRLNPFSDIYWRDLSQLFLAETNLILQDPNLSPETRERLSNLSIVQGGEAISRAIDIAPFNVANWNVRGFFYRNLIGIEGAGNLALASYQRAIQLEPASPYSFGEKGRVHILLAQDFIRREEEDLSRKHLDLALENLRKAIDLKSNYTPALYLIAVVYDQQGKLPEAISVLEETQIIIPQDLGVTFQLGLLYWRAERIKEAGEQFERALSLSPNHFNALYMLGLVYDERGKRDQAKEKFEKLIELDPQNQQLRKILENLEKGLPALEDIALLYPPIEETPPEIQR